MKISKLAENKLGRLPEISIAKYSPFRANSIFNLYVYLIEYDVFKNLDNLNQDKLVELIENNIYDETISVLTKNDIKVYENEIFIQHYSDISYKITSNISKNEEFLMNIINKKYKNIAEVSYEEIYPEGYINIKNIINERKDKKVNKKTSKLYKCGGCGTKETTVIEYQARSSDEPSTLSITCITCGKNWTM